MLIYMNVRFHFALLIFILPLAFISCAQQSFEEMANDMASKEIALIRVEELDSTCVLLDTRSFREFEVSHIEGAIWVGYDEFELSKFTSISKDKKIRLLISLACSKVFNPGAYSSHSLLPK